jgi:hypothetical protein
MLQYREAMIPSREQLAELKADFIQQVCGWYDTSISNNQLRASALAVNTQLGTVVVCYMQLKAGLSKDIDPNGRHMLMLPTFVTKMPTGYVSKVWGFAAGVG